MNTSNKFTEALEKTISATFPESKVSVQMIQITGDPFCIIRFTLGKDKSEYTNGYAENDNVKHNISIYGFDSEGNPKESLKVESAYTSFYAKSTNRLYAYDRIKTGWRNFTTTEDKAIVKIGDYFKKLKFLLIDNFDKLTADSQKLMIAKGYKK